MKLAIMQPYFFPYIGYWQLIHAADRFVIYDDVNYIKNGWINRNRILINGKPTYITVPLFQASSFKRICDTALKPSSLWRNKMVKSVANTYRKAPFFTEVFPIVEELIHHKKLNLSDYLVHQIETLTQFMGIQTEFVLTSRIYENNELTGQNRILDICKREKATTYINPIGGQSLYNTETFHSAEIDLRFISMHPLPYNQKVKKFVPYLSIIDVLMAVEPAEIKHHLNAFDLIRGNSFDVQ